MELRWLNGPAFALTAERIHLGDFSAHWFDLKESQQHGGLNSDRVPGNVALPKKTPRSHEVDGSPMLQKKVALERGWWCDFQM